MDSQVNELLEGFLILIKVAIIIGALVTVFGTMAHVGALATKVGQIARNLMILALLMFIITSIWQFVGFKYDVGLKVIKYGSLAYIFNFVWVVHFFIFNRR